MTKGKKDEARSADPNKGWDGTFNGKKLGSDVFVWNCKYQLEAVDC